MSRRRRRSDRRRFPVAECTALSALAGFALVFIFIVISAFLITKINATDTIISLMTSIALCIGAYFGGFVSAKKLRKNGLLMGVLCGIFMFLVIFIISVICAQKAAGLSGSSKLIMTLVCSALGGVVGVNSKNRRF